MEISKKTLNASQRPGNLPGGNGAHYSAELLEKARADTDTVLKELESQLSGLSEAEADSRLKQVGTNEKPFIESRASWPLILTSVIIVVAGAWLTVSPLAKTLGFVSLPLMYWLFLAIILLGYAILTQVVKTWFIRRFGD